MAPPLILRIIGDASSYFKTAEGVVSANTKVGQSALAMGGNFTKAAEAQVAAGAKAIQVQRAMVAELTATSAAAVAGSDEQIAATVALERAQANLNRSMGITAIGTRGVSTGAKTAERDLGKLTRGALAGSGVISALGRSLAFASGGFIAVAGTATLLHNAISEALSFAATEKQVTAQLKTSGLQFDAYKTQILQSLLAESKLSGFTRGELLQSFGYLVRVSGNVDQSLKLNAIAADVARGRHIALSSASIALAKALGGSSTALRRLGIIVPASAKGMDAIRYVAEKFAGQAEAGATSADHLRASFVNASEIIGTALLPTFNRLTDEFTAWLQKMEDSGRLQRDANEAFKLLGYVFHSLGDAIKFVDKVTGSFTNTLQILVGLEITKMLLGWVGALKRVAIEWGLVAGAATRAGAAQAEAGAAGGLGAGAAGAEAGGLSLLSGPGAIAATTVGIGLLAANAFTASTGVSHVASGSQNTVLVEGVGLFQKRGDKWYRVGGRAGEVVATTAQAAQAQTILSTGVGLPRNTAADFAQPGGARFTGGLPPAAGFAMTRYWKAFTKTFKQIMDEAQAALTKGTADDVAAARQEVARIKGMIARGQLRGPALFGALAAEANDLNVIWSAEAAAAQKRAAAAAAAKQKIITQIQNAIDPINLQIAFARAEALGGNTTAVLRKQLAAAYKGLAQAIANGNKQLILQAYQQIKSIKDAIKAALTTATSTFTVPAKLALDIARDQALGKGITDDLKEEKRALYKWIASHRKNIQGVTDAYNQIAAINSQLNSDVVNAYGMFKKASVKKLTENLGLTPDQRRRLEERLSQRGPGGTTPGDGTGAAGYVIDPATGRPVHRGHHRRHRGGSYAAGGASGQAPVVNATIELTVNIDGKQVEATVTKHQQRRRRHNPTQTRGPNAATSVA